MIHKVAAIIYLESNNETFCFFVCNWGSQIELQLTAGWLLLKLTQYKKLMPNALQFTYQNLKSISNHMKKQNKKHQNARSIDEKLKTKSLMFFVSFFSCHFQKYVNRKAFGASFLYWVDFSKGEYITRGEQNICSGIDDRYRKLCPSVLLILTISYLGVG